MNSITFKPSTSNQLQTFFEKLKEKNENKKKYNPQRLSIYRKSINETIDRLDKNVIPTARRFHHKPTSQHHQG